MKRKLLKPALFSGLSMLLFSEIWSLVVYATVAHWVWGVFASTEPGISSSYGFAER